MWREPPAVRREARARDMTSERLPRSRNAYTKPHAADWLELYTHVPLSATTQAQGMSTVGRL